MQTATAAARVYPGGNRERYQRVNDAWTETTPTLTREEAAKALKKLWHLTTKRTWPEIRNSKGKFQPLPIIFGSRRGWYTDGYHIRLSYGWRDLVHVLSHECFKKLKWQGEIKQDEPFHGTGHSSLERGMIAEVIKRGWLKGSLKAPVKPKVVRDLQTERYKLSLAKLKRWQTKAKRATTAIKKLKQTIHYYETEALKTKVTKK